MSSIHIRNLSKTFYINTDKKDSIKELITSRFRQGRIEKFHALKNINLDVNPGDFLGVMGLNGSGKSTLLQIIAGIYNPDKGSIMRVKGSVVPFLQLGVGFNGNSSAKDNVFLNGLILGMTMKEIKAVYKDIVDFAEVGDFMELPIKNFSSGMRMRLAFSIAIQTRGDIYLLDEILTVGDDAFREKSAEVFKRFKKEGKTILLVSHARAMIKEYCNRSIIISKGEKVFDGSVDVGIDFYDKIIDQAVADH